MIVPTVGRVVWYWRHGEVQMRDGGQPQPCAAIIARVHSNTCINIAFFDENGHAHNNTSVRLIQDEKITPEIQDPFCTWMPYQKSVAAGEILPTLHATPGIPEATEA